MKINIWCIENLSVYRYIYKTSFSHWENRIFANAKTKAQISRAVTAQLISAFVFATRIVQFLLYLNPKFQASVFFSATVQAGLCQTWSEPKLLIFSRTGSFIKRRFPSYAVCICRKYVQAEIKMNHVSVYVSGTGC